MREAKLKKLLSAIYEDFVAGKITKAGFNVMNQKAMNDFLKESLGAK
jgi:hypothetical protein